MTSLVGEESSTELVGRVSEDLHGVEGVSGEELSIDGGES